MDRAISNEGKPETAENEYRIGVMRTIVEEEVSAISKETVGRAVEMVDAALAVDMGLKIDVFDFAGPHLTPERGAYSPIDFLQIGVAEKLERGIHFLLIVTEVDLSASALSFVVALPSQLTNIGIISTRRLSPTFWGRDAEAGVEASRLSALMLHTIGHLIGLRHHGDPHNIMYDFKEVDGLGKMHTVTEEQMAQIRTNLPIEARDETTHDNRWPFILEQIVANIPGMWRVVRRANPARLLLKMTTMFTAALSVAVVLFFSAEIWDVGSTLSFQSLIIFSAVTIAVATLVLYRTFNISAGSARTGAISESTVVTAATTLLIIFLTVTLLYVVFFGLALGSSLTFFPETLKDTWPTADPASGLDEEINLSIFIAAISVLTGSLGGSADSKTLIRHILFLDEET